MGNFQPTIDYVSIKTGNVTFFEQLLKFLDGKMETPTLYGWYHILCLIAVIGLCVIVFFKARNISEKNLNLMMGLTSAILIILEVYKQLNYSYDPADDMWSYQWYAFPFQFCSTPMYVGLLGALTRGKLHSALCSYLATFALFAGLCVMVYPGDVFIGTIGINIQTMICHGSMVCIGIYLLATGYVKPEHRTVLKAIPVFAVCVLLAVIMNEVAHLAGLEETFNMFFVSPYWDCTLPVYSLIHKAVPFPINLIIYIAGFTAASWIILLPGIGLSKHTLTHA